MTHVHMHVHVLASADVIIENAKEKVLEQTYALQKKYMEITCLEL